MNKYGYKKSNFLSGDIIAKPRPSLLPDSYDLRKQLSPIRNQKSVPKCVSCVITDMIEWRLKYERLVGDFEDDYIFKLRKNKKVDGMSPREGFSIAKHIGLPTRTGTFHLDIFARVMSPEVAKRSIITNGPILIGLPVYNDRIDRFWEKIGSLIGGHAVSLVGWNSEGFILRNSWGTSYGNKGYSIFPFEEFPYIYESWTLIT